MDSKDFRISPLEGFTPQIGHLVSMLEIIRRRTKKNISNLTTEQLDYLEKPFTATIGTLLRHICCTEYVNQKFLFEKRKLTDEENENWANGFSNNLDRSMIKELPILYYINQFDQVRSDTIDYLKKQDDHWLYLKVPSFTGSNLNNYYMLFHIIEEELHHMGQIRLMISKFLPTKP